MSLLYRAKLLRRRKDLAFEEVHVDTDPKQMRIMMERSGHHTVPQIFIGDFGYDDLAALEARGELDPLLGR